MLDRPGRKLRAEQQQHADDRRPAVDDRTAFAADQVAAARGQDRPRDQRCHRNMSAAAANTQRRPSVAGRDPGQATARRVGVGRDGGERDETAARRDQTRASRP